MSEQTEKTKEEGRDVTVKDTELENDQATEEHTNNLDDDDSLKEKAPDFDMEKMYEQSLRQIHEGELITGEIIKLEEDYVLVDIGYKSEGAIPIAEFKNSEGTISA